MTSIKEKKYMDRTFLLNNPKAEGLARRNAKKQAQSSRIAQWITAIALTSLVGLVLVIMIAVVATDPFAPVARMEKTTGSLEQQMHNMTSPAQDFFKNLPMGQIDMSAADIFSILHNTNGITDRVNRIIGTVAPETIVSMMNYMTHIMGQFSKLLGTKHTDGSGRTLLTDIHDIMDESQRVLSQMDAGHIDRLMTEATGVLAEAKRIMRGIDAETLIAIKNIGRSIDEDHTVDALTSLATHLQTIVEHIEENAQVSVKLW